MEHGETIYDALTREMSEELPNVLFEIRSELGVIEHHWREPSGEMKLGVHYFFQVSAPTLSSTVLPPSVEAGLSFVWLPVAQLGTTPIQPPSLMHLIPQMLSGTTKLWAEIDS